jgi:hypothetical protein
MTTHEHGLNAEINLKSRLEEALDESITKTTNRYDIADYISDNWVVELKSRRKLDRWGKPQTPERFETWLLPSCKIDAYQEGKELVFFYHYEYDDSLWYIVYDPDTFVNFSRERPYWHATKQEHLLVPRECWTKVI